MAAENIIAYQADYGLIEAKTEAGSVMRQRVNETMEAIRNRRDRLRSDKVSTPLEKFRAVERDVLNAEKAINGYISAANNTLVAQKSANEARIAGELAPSLSRDTLAIYGLTLSQIDKAKLTTAMGADKNVLAAIGQMPEVLAGVDAQTYKTAQDNYLRRNNPELVKERETLQEDFKYLSSAIKTTEHLLKSVAVEFRPSDMNTVATGE